MSDSKTVVISISSGFPARNLLRTSFFAALKKVGVRIVILTPNPDELYFVREFEDENVVIEDLEKDKYERYLSASRTQQWIRLLRIYTGPSDQDLGTLDGRLALFEKHYLSKRNWILRQMFVPVVRLLRRSKSVRNALISAESFFFTPTVHHQTWQKYNPTLLITASTGGHWHGDAYLIREAKRKHIPTVCFVQSWDNPSSYGMEGARADYYIVWSEQMKRDLMKYQEVSKPKIFVGGAPVFELHKDIEQHISKGQFFNEMGLDPNRKTILYGTISPKDWQPYDLQVVEFLLQCIADEKFKIPVQLIVRFHPRHYVGSSLLEPYYALQYKYPYLYLNQPRIMSERLPLDMPRNEQLRIAALLRYADVLVNVWSTLSIEAALCNTPIINIAFDPEPELNSKMNALLEQRPDQMMQRPHIKRLIKSGGVRAARSWQELTSLVNLFLENPNLDEEERIRLADQEIGTLDSKCGERIVEYLMNQIECEERLRTSRPPVATVTRHYQ